MSHGRVVMLVENDYQDQEVWVPLYRLREEGYETIVAAPKAGTYSSKYGYPVKAEVAASDLRARDLAGIVIPGGWAPDRLRQDPAVLKLVRDLFELKRPVTSLCHGGLELAAAVVAPPRPRTADQPIHWAG